MIRREPVLSGLLALEAAVVTLLVAFGVNLTSAQQSAIAGFFVALLTVGYAIRRQVSPVKNDE